LEETKLFPAKKIFLNFFIEGNFFFFFKGGEKIWEFFPKKK